MNLNSLDVLNSVTVRPATVFEANDTSNADGIYNLTNVTSDEVSAYSWPLFKAAEYTYDTLTGPGRGLNTNQKRALNAKIAEIRSKYANGSNVQDRSLYERVCNGLLKAAGLLNKTMGERIKWLTGESLKAVGIATMAQAVQKREENPVLALINTGIGAMACIAGRVLTHGANITRSVIINGAHTRERAEIERFVQSDAITKLADK